MSNLLMKRRARSLIRSGNVNNKSVNGVRRTGGYAGETQQSEEVDFEFNTGLDALDAVKAAEEVEVTVEFPVVYLYDKPKDGSDGRYNQRFYQRGLFIPDSNGVEHDMVFNVVPRLPKGFVVDAEMGEAGTLVVKTTKSINVYKYALMNPKSPARSAVKMEFAATPEFVSFNGKKAVDTAPAAEEEHDSEE